MTFNPVTLVIFLAGIILILYLFERNRRLKGDKANKSLENAIKELDEQAKMIIKSDLSLSKMHEELDKKITGLYTLHELGKKTSATFNIDDLPNLINQALVLKLGFSRAIMAFKDEHSGNIAIKTSIGYSDDEIKRMQKELNKKDNSFLTKSLFRKTGFLLVNMDSKKIEHEDILSDIFKTESFLTVPIVVKDEPVGFILMGNESSYNRVAQGDAELLSILASQIGTAIENTHLYTELFNSRKDLERRVKERTEEFARFNKELKKLNKMKSDFVSAVSHELRTPLTSIKGYASILMAGKLGDVSPQQKERLEKIDIHSNNLTRLVNNLLDIARIESGKVQMDLKDMSIKKLLDSIVDITTPQIKEKDILLKIDSKITVDKIKADPGQLERVFINLLGNAIKFTPKKGKITISIEEKKDAFKFSIEDTGIGIPKKDLERVFEDFFRSDNAQDQNIKGTGLGLSLVKKIVLAHKGEIWVDSELDNGSKFSFIIPRSQK